MIIARSNRMDIQIAWFDGYDVQSFAASCSKLKPSMHRSSNGAKMHVYLESP